MSVVVAGRSLSLEDVVAVARRRVHVVLAEDAKERILASEQRLRGLVANGSPIYGLTTGVGALDTSPVPPAINRLQQRALLRSHAAGVGESMTASEVRAMLLARVNALAGGVSGIRLEVVAALVDMLNSELVPRVPRRGSVGASDMAPLAHASLVLVGEGRGWVGGIEVDGLEALHRAGLSPVDLELRDAFALINGTAQSAGIAALAVIDAQALVRTAEVATAMVMTAVGSRHDFLDARLEALRPHAGTVESGAHVRSLLAGTQPSHPLAIREPLSTRSAAQVHGALREAIALAARTVNVEINSHVDNPVVLPDGWTTNTSGLPHAQGIAWALDALSSATASAAVMSERRTARLLDAHHNGGLPAFLVHPKAQPGASSGLMIAQYTAAAIVAELRISSSPASLQSIPVCANSEDHGSMSALGAIRLAQVVALSETAISIELLVAAQGIDLSGRAPSSGLAPYLAMIRQHVPVAIEDRLLGDDIEALTTLIRSESWRALLERRAVPST